VLENCVDEVAGEGEIGNFGVRCDVVGGGYRAPDTENHLVEGFVLEGGERGGGGKRIKKEGDIR